VANGVPFINHQLSALNLWLAPIAAAGGGEMASWRRNGENGNGKFGNRK
jgi:hypothetical protein